MKQYLLLLALSGTTLTATAQTLRVEQGSVTTAFNAITLGEASFSAGGTSLTLSGKTYDISTIDRMTINNTPVAEKSVGVVYNGNSATVELSGDLAPYLTVLVDGANVNITADALYQDEITYTLSGSSESGSFTMEGDFKATVALNGVSLTSTTVSMPAIHILNGKRIKMVVNGTNTFADCAGGTHKGAFFLIFTKIGEVY